MSTPSIQCRPKEWCWRGRARSMMNCRVVDRVGVAIAEDVPEQHLVALADRLSADFGVFLGGTPHVNDRRHLADDLSDIRRVWL
ncbi:MAG: hypothetical protein WCA23_10890, partial [Stellaceae bacterium]